MVGDLVALSTETIHTDLKDQSPKACTGNQHLDFFLCSPISKLVTQGPKDRPIAHFLFLPPFTAPVAVQLPDGRMSLIHIGCVGRAVPIPQGIVWGGIDRETKGGQSGGQNGICNFGIDVNCVVYFGEIIEDRKGRLSQHLPVCGGKGVEGLSSTMGGVLMGSSAILPWEVLA